MEIEVPVREPRTFSHITRHKQHLLQLKTVLMTIYYPASPPPSDQKPSRQLWLGRPRLSVAQGYSHFAKLGNLAVPMFLPTMFTKLPAWRNAPLSDRLPPNSKPSEGPKTREEAPKFPLMVFSHGLGGTNTAYSSVCGEVCTSLHKQFEIVLLIGDSLRVMDSSLSLSNIEMGPGLGLSLISLTMLRSNLTRKPTIQKTRPTV